MTPPRDPAAARRVWSESGHVVLVAPPRPRPAVRMPGAGAVLSPAQLVSQLTAATCRRWHPWAANCLVCHAEVPEGQATVYAHLKARVCASYCSDLVTSLERVCDRSRRGRWRPLREVRAMANGELCNACMRPVS